MQDSHFQYLNQLPGKAGLWQATPLQRLQSGKFCKVPPRFTFMAGDPEDACIRAYEVARINHLPQTSFEVRPVLHTNKDIVIL